MVKNAMHAASDNCTMKLTSSCSPPQARVVEDARHVASDGVNAQGRAISKRPDLVARSNMEKAKAMVNTSKVAGHVPGIAVFDRLAPVVLCSKC